MVEQQVLGYWCKSLSLFGLANSLVSQKHWQMNVFVGCDEINILVDKPLPFIGRTCR